MIIIHPVKDTRHAATDDIRCHINYVFADYLRKYIEIKGDECMLSRKSEDAPNVEIKSLKDNYSPTVTFTIDCYVDIDSSVSGYHVICDAYSALVATIIYEIYKQDRTPIKELGYAVSGSLKYGKYADITIYLGYLTNADDLALLSDESFLDTMAKRIVEGAYGPPIKTIEDVDSTGNDDPYFYRIDTWKQTEEEGTSSGEILETLYSGLPVRYLAIDSQATGYYPVSADDDSGEAQIPVPRHYTWYTPLTYTASTECLVIVSIRSQGGTVTAYMKAGSTEYTQDISDTTFTIVMFEASVDPNSIIEIGVEGSGRLDYSGIWVAPKGNLGILDDPRSSYSIFPPGYRSVTTVTSAYNTADAIHIAITDAHSLLERAQDKEETAADEAVAASSSSSSDSGSSALNFAFSVLGYASALSGIMGMISNFSTDKVTILDPTKINVDYKGLEESIKSVKDVASKANVISAVNDIKNMSSSVENQLKDIEIPSLPDTSTLPGVPSAPSISVPSLSGVTQEEIDKLKGIKDQAKSKITEEAKGLADKTKAKIEAKGVALGKS